jgi:hypothetical protein
MFDGYIHQDGGALSLIDLVDALSCESDAQDL